MAESSNNLPGSDTDSPFDAAEDYRAKGWLGTIRLPHREKHPPPTGFTGYGGADPTPTQVAQWRRRRGNIGLRLPETVIGIDVDAYGDKNGGDTLAAKVAELGELPPTWRSTSRHDDPVSGIRFYRVPAGRQWADELGPNVEIIHRGHRYAVVAPSIHPEDREYLWFDETGELTFDVPTVAELPQLPAAWVADLDRGDTASRDHKADLKVSDAWAWVLGLPEGDVSSAVEDVLSHAASAFESGGSRHNIARDHLLRLLRLGEQGHAGIRAAVDTLESMFSTALGGDRADEGEWERMVTGGVALVLANPTPTAAEVFDDLSTSLFDATPTLRHIRDAAHSRLVGSQALLCVVLARVLAELPPSVTLPAVVGGRGSLNLGIALVGGSGTGKSAQYAVSRELLGGVGFMQEEIERNLGSGEGLAQTFLQKQGKTQVLISYPHRILMVDEIDSLGATQHRSGATIAPTLRSALTGSALGQTNATAERNRHIRASSYRLVLLLGVQPTRSATLLDDADAGTPQRLVWVTATDPTLPDEDVEWPGPLEWSLPSLPEGVNEIDYPEHVKAEVRAARRAQVLDASADPLAGHRLLTRLKVAAALALLHGDVAINDLWWGLAGTVIDLSSSVQAECKQVLAEEQAKARLAAGRLDGIRAEGAASYRDERVVKAAGAIWRKVAQHAAGAKDGNDQRHEPEEGCTERCVGRALRNYPDRAEIREAARAHAVDADWTDERDGRLFPGESRPA